MKSLGIIEVVSLTAAVEAADVAVKSANVELVGYELAKGGGFVTVKVLGDVGAVQAAMSAAKQAAGAINRVVSCKVIARPAAQIENLVYSTETVGYEPPKPKTVVKPATTPKTVVKTPAAPEPKPAATPAAPEPKPAATPAAEKSTPAAKRPRTTKKG